MPEEAPDTIPGGELRIARAFSPGTVTCEVDSARGLVFITFTGVVTLDLVRSAQSRAQATPGFQAVFPTLIDYTRADLTELDTEHVKKLAGSTPVAASVRRAFLVADDLAYGLGRMFRALSDIAGRGQLVEVFRDRQEALR